MPSSSRHWDRPKGKARRTPGVVEYIIETEEEMREWSLDEKGVLLASEPFGSVFWPLEEKDDPVVFVARANT